MRSEEEIEDKVANLKRALGKPGYLHDVYETELETLEWVLNEKPSSDEVKP